MLQYYNTPLPRLTASRKMMMCIFVSHYTVKVEFIFGLQNFSYILNKKSFIKHNLKQN